MTFVSLGDPNIRAQALVSGHVEATTMSVGTWVTIQQNPSVKVLVDAADYFNTAPVVAKVDASTQKEIQGEPEKLQRFTTAILKASRAFANKEQTWVDAVSAPRSDISPGQLHNLWEEFRTSWAVNGGLNLTEYQATADYDYSTIEGLRDQPHIGVQAWTDTRFVDAALKQIGVDGRMDDPDRPVP